MSNIIKTELMDLSSAVRVLEMEYLESRILDTDSLLDILTHVDVLLREAVYINLPSNKPTLEQVRQTPKEELLKLIEKKDDFIS